MVKEEYRILVNERLMRAPYREQMYDPAQAIA
jgi:hypothetical protein